MTIKLMFADNGTILGCQIVGIKGVDKRIDLISMAMRTGLKAQDLTGVEAAYAPPYSSAKDPVNFIGFIVEDILNGLTAPVQADAMPENAVVVDVREPGEQELGAIPGAIFIRLADLRKNLDKLDKNRPIVCCCAVGLRGYIAELILRQNGFDAHNLSGGYRTWKMFYPDDLPAPTPKSAPAVAVASKGTLDVRSLPCPGPVMKLRGTMENSQPGDAYHVLAALTFEGDLKKWVAANNHTLGNFQRLDDHLEADVIKGMPKQQAVSDVNAQKQLSIVLFSNDFDKAMAALILANGFAATGTKVNLFFTFWGLSVLRKNPAIPVKKNLISKMFGWMLPSGAKKLALSKMNMMGMGTAMMKSVMKQKNVQTLPELLDGAHKAGVRFIACEMAMDVMGMKVEELDYVDEVAGVATFAALGSEGGVLFI